MIEARSKRGNLPECARLVADQKPLLGDAWQSYEAGKKRLNELEMSPAEYELAIKRLAETLGI
jgi:hypothetical protein